MQIYHTTMEISHILYYNTMILLDNKRCKTIKTLKQKTTTFVVCFCKFEIICAEGQNYLIHKFL
jgi:hypothetical protein